MTVHLDEELEEDDTLVAMAHRDTNDNEEYDFDESEGEEDGPYTGDDDEAVTDTAEAVVGASVDATDAESDGNTVVVDQVDLSEGGFVTAHDASLLAGETLGSVRGTSDYLEPGDHEDVQVTLDEPYEEDGTAIAMPHMDTNDDEAYDFVDEEGGADGPYTDGGEPVLDDAQLTVESGDVADNGGSADEPDEDEQVADGDGVVAALLAVLGAVLVARGRR